MDLAPALARPEAAGPSEAAPDDSAGFSPRRSRITNPRSSSALMLAPSTQLFLLRSTAQFSGQYGSIGHRESQDDRETPQTIAAPPGLGISSCHLFMNQPLHHQVVPAQTGFDRLVQIMAALRAPDGCPWDRKQTHDSLKPYLLEETYEVLETIDQQDMAKLREELGDLLLQILFHAQIAAEQGRFTIEDVMGLLANKLIRRHPHVFNRPDSGQDSLSPEEVYGKWEQIKKQEREAAGRTQSVLDGVPNTLPALLRAYQVQARASRVGFDWPDSREGTAQVLDKVEEECRELRAAASADLGGDNRARAGSQEQITAEFGDVLFSLVNLARKLAVNPEDALRLATGRFVDRFHYIEAEARRAGRSLDSMTLEEMDRLWAEAKKAAQAEDRTPMAAPRPSGTAL